ncbi:hypothetical protein QE152_g25524 [Popillia japonica]|uniref:Uncharacterized protein n=1 Tax=Popillia japonica TaxID=7064 RepID=A0AAW1K1B2_POPJA
MEMDQQERDSDIGDESPVFQPSRWPAQFLEACRRSLPRSNEVSLKEDEKVGSGFPNQAHVMLKCCHLTDWAAQIFLVREDWAAQIFLVVLRKSNKDGKFYKGEESYRG